MPSSTLTSKGQTTIPREIRERLRIRPGDRLDFVAHDDGTVTLHARNRHVSELAGLLYRPGRKPATIRDMHDAVTDGAVERFLRSSRKTRARK